MAFLCLFFMLDKNKKYFGTIINIWGSYYPEPLELELSDYEYDDETVQFWDKEGDVDFIKLGIDIRERVVRFCSESREEVALFIAGVTSYRQILKDYFNG